MNNIKMRTIFNKYHGLIQQDTVTGKWYAHNMNDMGLMGEDMDLVIGKVKHILNVDGIKIVELEPYDIGDACEHSTKEEAINEIIDCYS